MLSWFWNNEMNLLLNCMNFDQELYGLRLVLFMRLQGSISNQVGCLAKGHELKGAQQLGLRTVKTRSPTNGAGSSQSQEPNFD